MANKSYTAADIAAYWQGRLTPAERHAMEKAALEDPFLADAMEGYQQLLEKESTPVSAQRAILEKRLQQRIAGEKKNRIAWWKPAIAASVLLVAGTMAWMYLKNDGSTALQPAEVAQKESAPVIDVPGVMDTTLPSDPVVALQEKPATGVLQQAPSPEAKKERRQEPAASPAPAPKAEEDDAASDRSEALSGRVPGVAINETEAKKAEAPSRSYAAARKAPDGIIRGVVRNEKSEPVAGAVLQLKNKQSAIEATAITNDKGEYQLPVTRSEDSNKLAATVIGYVVAEKPVSAKDSSINFNLAPSDAALSEVVVMGYGTRKKSTANEVQPVNGWDNFHHYLEDSARVPSSLSNIHGNVELAFELDAFGRPEHFVIKNSLHPTLDAEAIRLIEKGPAWETNSRKRKRVRTAVRF